MAEETTSLKYKAHLALEGSERTEEAFANLRDYLTDLNDRTLLTIMDVNVGAEVGGLLRLLRALADPDGSTPYRLQIIPRSATGRPPNPAKKRIRSNDGMFAALYADRLLARDPSMQKKKANSLAAAKLGVAISEVHAGRKTEAYKLLEDWNRDRAAEGFE